MARTTTFIAGVVAVGLALLSLTGCSINQDPKQQFGTQVIQELKDAGLTSITPMGAADYNGPSATHLTQKFRFVNNSCMIQGFVQAGEWNMYTAYVITYLLNPF